VRGLLLRPLILFWRYWPQLAACYLVGILGRQGAIELAARLGYDNDWWAAVIMPLAGLARLGSFVAMFMLLRPAIPVLADLPARSSRRIDLFATVIVPFFAIYLAWQLFRDDWLAFERRALDYRAADAINTPGIADLHPGTLPVGASTWVLIAAAFVGRWLLGKLKDRLPTWLVAVQIYLDALWIFLVLSFSANKGVTLLFNPTGWIQERRIVVWFNDIREKMFTHFHFLETMWDAVMSALRTVFGGAAVPLMWLAVAGIVYGVSAGDWRGATRRLVGTRSDRYLDRAEPARKVVTARWSKVPKSLRDKSRSHAEAQLGRFRPITDSARLIAHGGLLAVSTYVLLYLVLAWLDMSDSYYRAQLGSGYLFRFAAWLLGPHPYTFWSGTIDAIALTSHLIVEPLRLCLIASTVAFCLEHVTARNEAAPSALQQQPHDDSPVEIDDVDSGGQHVAGQ
jgi:hypothetical protein